MADAVEVAIELALLARLQALTLSPAVPLSLPNVTFADKPDPAPGAQWLRATLLPARSFALGVDGGASNQHYGILQVDVFQYQGDGEPRAGRLASLVIQHFKRGTRLTRNGFTIDVYRDGPYRGNLMKDDPWVFIPVSVPYLCFANNPS